MYSYCLCGFEYVNSALAQGNSALSQGTWFLLQTTSDDIYVLNGDWLYDDLQLSGPLSFTTLAFSLQVKGPFKKQMVLIVLNGLQELPTYHVDQNNNGLFDFEDAIIFYSHGPHDWILENTEVSLNFNHYSDAAGFFLRQIRAVVYNRLKCRVSLLQQL